MDSELRKSANIKAVLRKLFERFGESNFVLTDFWDADLDAIGIKSLRNGEYLVYISTWKTEDKHYFVEVEDSDKEVILNGYKSDELNQIDFKGLSEIIEKYLRLQPIYEQ